MLRSQNQLKKTKAEKIKVQKVLNRENLELLKKVKRNHVMKVKVKNKI